MKKFCISLREHAVNVINFEKRKMLSLTKKSYYQQVRDHCHFAGKYRGTAHGICNLRYNVPNKILVVFHNGVLGTN